MMRQPWVTRKAGGKEGGRWARPQLERLEEREVLDAATLGFLTQAGINTAVLAAQTQTTTQSDVTSLQQDLKTTGVAASTLIGDLDKVVKDVTLTRQLGQIDQLVNNAFLGQLLSGGLNQANPTQILTDALTLGLVNTLVSGAVQQADTALGTILQSAVGKLPLNLSGITNQGGQLLANGSIGGQSFTGAPITLAPAAGNSQILALMLGPIHLDLLGLHVDTSPICLSITDPGAGQQAGSLGDIVHRLLGGLNGGQSQATVLNGLSSQDLGTLTSDVTSLLNTGLLNLANPGQATANADPTTQILHLSIGPLNLNLLGLNIKLDNCNNGPVTVDITAQAGQGNLLGNLLTDVANLLNSPPTTALGVDPLVTALAVDLLSLL